MCPAPWRKKPLRKRKWGGKNFSVLNTVQWGRQGTEFVRILCAVLVHLHVTSNEGERICPLCRWENWRSGKRINDVTQNRICTQVFLRAPPTPPLQRWVLFYEIQKRRDIRVYVTWPPTPRCESCNQLPFCIYLHISYIIAEMLVSSLPPAQPSAIWR